MTSSTLCTGTPAPSIAAALPPVEMMSYPCSERPCRRGLDLMPEEASLTQFCCEPCIIHALLTFASSTKPVLSDTLTSALLG